MRASIMDVPAARGSTSLDRRSLWSDRLSQWVVYWSVVFAGLALAAVAHGRPSQPYFGAAWGCFLLLLAAWVRFPRFAFGATILLTLGGDLVTVAWWPFAKNLSSYESIMYLSDSVSLSPLEITVAWALAVTGLRNIAISGRPFRSAPLIVPFMVFGGFLVMGMARGLSRGGDTRAAIYEVRPLILLPLTYLLAVNICRDRQDYRRMFAVCLAAVVLQAGLSLQYLSTLSQVAREELESLNEHGSSIGMNVLFMTTIAALAYRGVRWGVRVGLVLACVPVMWVYLVAQRRAAVVALVVGFTMFAVMIFWRQRRTFWKVVPIVTVLAVGYLGAFWQSDSSAAFPAQAVKSVIAPDQASPEDLSSDLYRQLEKLNISATVRASPALGIGFGQAFYRPYSLADISFFEYEAYVPHNSIIWVWIKMGFGGFVALLFIIGRTLVLGASRARGSPNGIDAVFALIAVIFVAMYAVFLYVDIGWEARNVVILALSMGLCTGRLADEPTDVGTSHRTAPDRGLPAGTRPVVVDSLNN